MGVGALSVANAEAQSGEALRPRRRLCSACPKKCRMPARYPPGVRVQADYLRGACWSQGLHPRARVPTLGAQWLLCSSADSHLESPPLHSQLEMLKLRALLLQEN